jgi:gliding motility-associated-like protein
MNHKGHLRHAGDLFLNRAMKGKIILLLLLFAGKFFAQNPVASFSFDPQPSPSSCVQFTSTSSPDVVNYRWSFDDGAGSQSTQPAPVFCYSDSGCYNVKLWVQNQSGNTDSVTHTVCIHGETNIFMPNAFTPNGDGVNDIFYVYGTFIPENKFEMSIYDYWGSLVFYSDDPYRGWNGACLQCTDMVQQGYYRIELIWFDTHNEKHTYRGAILLMR